MYLNDRGLIIKLLDIFKIIKKTFNSQHKRDSEKFNREVNKSSTSCMLMSNYLGLDIQYIIILITIDSKKLTFPKRHFLKEDIQAST